MDSKNLDSLHTSIATLQSVSLSASPLLSEIRLEGEKFVAPAANPSQLRLYGHYLCPDVEATLIAFAFKKIPYQFVSVDFPTRPDWFFRLPSEGHIPLLEFHGKSRYIRDSLPIIMYLDEAYPDSGSRLFPGAEDSPLLKARLRELMGRAEEMCGLVSKFSSSQGKDKDSLAGLAKTLGWLESALEISVKNPFFEDQKKPTLADIMMIPHIRRLMLLQGLDSWTTLDVYSKTPRLMRWYRNMLDLPEVAKNTASRKWYLAMCDWRAKTGQYTLPIFASHPPGVGDEM